MKLLKLSIIIPIYNADIYLENCLKNIVKQINNNDEIILINDGSTDSSLDICNRYKSIYKNIKVIDKKNEGVSIARNVGLDLAIGDYIVWIDSDDWVNDNYIFLVKKYLKETEVDILIFDYYEVRKVKDNYQYKYKKYKEYGGFIAKDMIMVDIAQDAFSSLLWRTVVKKEIYKNISFPVGKQMMEDFSIYHMLFDKAKTFFYLKKPLYYYRVLNNSLSHKNLQDVYSMYNISIEREIFIKEKYPNIDEKYRMIPVFINACLLVGKGYLSKEKEKNIYMKMKKNIFFILSRSYINKKKKFQMMVYIISPKLLYVIRRLVKG